MVMKGIRAGDASIPDLTFKKFQEISHTSQSNLPTTHL